MNIDVHFTPAMVQSELELRQSTVVVIDTLRATSTITIALMNGAREVAPVATIEEAVQVAQRLGTERTLLCGEKNSLKIEGFDLGNSPLEYTPEIITGKTLVMTTTNGTRALTLARAAQHVLCGALVNAGAVAYYLREKRPEHLIILCAGTEGNYSLEDTLAAGAIVEGLVGEEHQLTDSALSAMETFWFKRDDLPSALRSAAHGKRLCKGGMSEDVEFCSQLNIPNAPVPVMEGFTLRLL